MNSQPGSSGRPVDGPPSLLTITSRNYQGSRIVVAGELDRDTTTLLTDTLTSELTTQPPPANMCVDLSGVTFTAAAGVNALIAGYHYGADHGTRVQLTNVHGIALHVLQVLHLDTTLIGANS